MSSSSNALSEARGLLMLTRSGETVDSIRALIGSSPERQSILLAFDRLAQRIPKRPEKMRRLRLRMYGNGSAAGPALRAEIFKLLTLNLSQTKVQARLKVSRSVVEQVARETGTAYNKIGRGRKFTAEQIQEFVAALRSGIRPAKLMRQHHVCAELIRKLRRTHLNDFADRRYLRAYDVEQVKKALTEGLSLSEIVQKFGIDRGPLWKLRQAMGDCKDRRHENRRIFSSVERAEMIADIRAGMSQSAVARKFHTHTDRVRSLEAEVGLPRKYRVFTADDLRKLYAGFRDGKRNAEIAKEIGCTTGAIWSRRKQMCGAEREGIDVAFTGSK